MWDQEVARPRVRQCVGLEAPREGPGGQGSGLGQGASLFSKLWVGPVGGLGLRGGGVH